MLPDMEFLPALQSVDDGTLEHGAKILTGTDRDTIGPFIDFAKWAMAETGASNLGEAIVNAINQSHAPEVWSQLAAVPLADIASPFPHPYQAITSWADELEPRDKAILSTRIASFHRTQTLEELANDFGVTRERIRQVEARIRRKLQSFLQSNSAAPILWRAISVRDQLGVSAPEAMVEELLAAEGTGDYRAIILELAGPYQREDDGWLIDRSSEETDPTPVILAELDEVGPRGRDIGRAGTLEVGAGRITAQSLATQIPTDQGVQRADSQVGNCYPRSLGFCASRSGPYRDS